MATRFLKPTSRPPNRPPKCLICRQTCFFAKLWWKIFMPSKLVFYRQWFTEISLDDVSLFSVSKETRKCQDSDNRQKRMPFPETSLLHSKPVQNNRILALHNLSSVVKSHASDGSPTASRKLKRDARVKWCQENLNGCNSGASKHMCDIVTRYNCPTYLFIFTYKPVFLLTVHLQCISDQS